jgi:glutathione S-transferase
MSKPQIYGMAQSRAARCLWAARELGIDFEHVATDFKDGSKTPEFLKINPNGRIPALRDGDFTLFESLAINTYLVKKYGANSGLAPKTLEDDARCQQWSLWAMTEVEKPLLTILLHAVGMQPVDEASLAKATKDLQRPFKVLEGHLSQVGHDYLLGASFTLADLNVASVLTWIRGTKLDMSAYPKLTDWLKRCTSRPAAKPPK